MLFARTFCKSFQKSRDPGSESGTYCVVTEFQANLSSMTPSLTAASLGGRWVACLPGGLRALHVIQETKPDWTRRISRRWFLGQLGTAWAKAHRLWLGSRPVTPRCG
jgi:hypothetical protein